MDLGDEGRRLECDNKEDSNDSSSSSVSNDSLEDCQNDYEKRATLEMKTIVKTENFTDIYLGDSHELERSAIDKRKKLKAKTACRWSVITFLLVGAITVAVLIGGISNHSSISQPHSNILSWHH